MTSKNIKTKTNILQRDNPIPISQKYVQHPVGGEYLQL